MVIAENFTASEIADIQKIAAAGMKTAREKSEKGISPEGLAGTGGRGKAEAGILKRSAREVLRGARANVVGSLLSLLPDEVQAAIRGAAFLGGITTIPGSQVIGAAAGVVIRQAQRKLEREQERVASITAAGGILAGKEFVTEQRLDLDSALKEFQNVRQELDSALSTGDVNAMSRIIIKIGTENKALASAVRDYLNSIADWQGHTRSKTAAELAFARAQGPYVPRALYESYSVMQDRIIADLNDFYKDPPIRG